MKEILAGNIDLALQELNIEAKLIYEGNYYRVYKLEDSMFEKICNIPDSEWKDKYGWWRSAKGSVLGYLDTDAFKINGKDMIGFVDDKWEERRKEYSEDDGVEYTLDEVRDTEYNNLISYICEELGASTEKNVTAVAMDLAMMNNMSMGELFSKYEG